MLISEKRPGTLWGWFPWACLGGATIIGILTLYRGAFGDEADNLAVGALVREGYALYRDVFSHHFPLPYYWMAVVVAICGRSLFAARFSILLLHMGAFALPMALNRERLALGLAALGWGLLRLFYRGNMVLYSSFCAPALAVVFVLTLGLLTERHPPRWAKLALVGLAGAFAILSDPLAIYATAIALVSLFIQHPRRGWAAAGVCALAGGAALGALAVAGTLDDFWREAILFNAQVYGKYLDTNPVRLKELAKMALTALEFFDRAWWHADPLRPISTQYTQFDQWVFTGLLYRAACLALTAFLAWRRQWRAAAFAYLFAAATLVINKWDFRGQPFVLTAIIALMLVLTGLYQALPSHRTARVAGLILGVGLALMAAWLGLRLGFSLVSSRQSLSSQTFRPWREQAEQMLSLSCHHPEARLGIYPGGGSIYTYFFSGMKPVSRYVFMWPWVAEVGIEEVIGALDQEGTMALVVRQEAVIWERYDTRVYLRPLDEFLQTHYVPVGEGMYRSPALEAFCHAQK